MKVRIRFFADQRGAIAAVAVTTVVAAILSAALPARAAHVNPGVISSIALNGYPQCVEANPATNRVYVHHWQPSAVAVIAGATNQILTHVPLDGYSWSGCIGVNPVTNRIYVALTFNSSNFIHSGVDALVVIDGATNRIIATTDVGRGAMGVGVNPATNRIYVANFYGSSVTVIDGVTNAPITTIPVGSRPQSAAVNPVTNRVYVASADTRSLYVIDGDTNIVAAIVPYDASLDQVADAAVNIDTNLIYVAHWSPQKLSVVDGTTHTIVGTISLPIPADNVRVSPLTNHVYVAPGPFSNSVAVVDADTASVVATVATGSQPQPLALNPLTDRVYVGNFFSRSLTVLGDRHAPVALNDSYTTIQATALSVPAPGVLANDVDEDPGTTLQAVLVTGPAHGSLTLHANGSFTYVPHATFAGVDTFTYRATDGALSSQNATVALTVTSLDSIIDAQPGLTSGQKAALKAKLDDAAAFFQAGNVAAACDKLAAFISQVQDVTPAKLSADVAVALISSANALKASYGCP